VTTLEFRIPISPTPGFFASVRLIALSLARMGPPYSAARILVSVGDCTTLDQVRAENPWAAGFPVEWRIVPYDRFEAVSYMATGNDRYAEGTRADIVILCDADICPVARFDLLLATLALERPMAAGLQAHFPPFRGSAEEGEAAWRKVFADAGLAHRPLIRRYSIDPGAAMGWAPPYFNYGFVAFNRPAFERAAPIAQKYTLRALEILDEPFFAAQIGLTLTLAAAGITSVPLGHGYNCANDDRVFGAGLSSEDDIRIIHYLREDEFDRRVFLSDPAALRNFLSAAGLCRVSERLRRHVASLADQLGANAVLAAG
jgi:hypothetical protein